MNIIRNKLYFQIPTVLFLATMLAMTQLAGAAADTWNNAAGGNWSVAGNWSGGAPGSTSDVIFGNTGAGFSNTNNISSLTIDSLNYNQSNGSNQVTVIPPGQTLTIASSVAAGNFELYAGNTPGASGEQVNAAIQGLSSTVTMTGLGDIWSAEGGTANVTPFQDATLNLSGLGTLNATIGRLLVGVNVNGINRMAGEVILAQTNNLTFTGASPQVEVGEAVSNGNSGAGSADTVLSFGQTNNLYADTMRIGGDKCNVAVNFAAAINSAPTLRIRNNDGVSPCTVIDFGYANGDGGTGTTETMAADFSAGSIDLLSSLVHMPQGQPGLNGTSESGSATATITLGAGTFNVADLEIGWGNSASTSTTGNTTGTLNVNNNGLFSAGAKVICGTVLNLARTNGCLLTTISGTVNVNGGEVDANTITSGGGVSAINLNSFSPSSTLVVTNTVGTLSRPIGTFSIADATLSIPALNGGATIAVKTLTVGGSGNVINISSIPPIGSYPATFTLINYQNGYTAGTGPLSLGTLPSGGYSGSLVDAGGGVIQLQLTAGPAVNLGMLWTGATDNNWDLSTFDWKFAGVATNFFNGSSPIFNDTAAQSNIVLTTALSPGSITVSNNLLPYTFTGSGNLTGVSSLTKTGTNALIVANSGVDEIGTVVISSGTLQIGTNDLNGTISSVNITDNGALVVDRSGSLALSAAIAGAGSLTENGSGSLILSGANSYAGTTTVSGGTLEIDGTSSGAGALTTSAGTVLAGSGTNNGAITVGGQMNPGSSSAPGIFTANGGLTLNSGSTLTFRLNAAGNPTLSDSVVVGGNLNVNNNTITVNFDGPPSGGTYPLFTYTGNLSGSFNPTVIGTHYAVAVDTSTPGVVNLDVNGGSGSSLSWASTSDSTWDQSTTNWLDLNSGLPSTFNTGDTVLLDDSNGVVTTITIPSGVNVAPTSITDTATNNNFVINGAGSISGSTGIVLSGPSTLEIDTANTFSGAVDVQAGTLRVGNGQALGTASGTTVENGATLDVNGQNISSEAITVSGSGVSGNGAIVNEGAADLQAFRTLILAGDTTIGCDNEIEMNNSGGTASISTGNQSFSLTKVGASILNLQNLATVDGSLSNIDVQGGTLLFNGLTPNMGDPNGTNTIEAGATLAFGSDTVAWNKNFVFNGDGSTINLNNEGGATTELDGPVVLNGDCVFTVGGTSLTITNTISGDGGIIKNGGSPMILTGPTTYIGTTTINTAALRLNGAATLSTSTNIVINSGGFLTVTGMVSSTFPLASGQTLSGNGVLVGSLTASAGSTVSPAVTPSVSPVGTLTVSNQVALSGTLIMQIDPANSTNDMLVSGHSSITYGGTLSLTNLSAPSAGNSFKLFSASSYSGSFASIAPASPGPGLAWNTSALGTSGTISVVSTAPLAFGGTVIVGANVVFSGSGGVASSPYYVLASTNVALPLTNWTRIATNSFDGNGNFAFTNSLAPSVPQKFFLLQTP